MGVLGCGQYEVHILTRGGATLVTVFPWTQISWGRVLDDTSQAQVDAATGDCCGLLALVRPWRHEVALFRDGAPVWVGPVSNPTSNPDASSPRVTEAMTARDLSAWWDHRFLHNDHDFSSPVDLATIFQAYADDAMAADPSPGFSISASPCGVEGSRTVLANDHLIAGQELRSIAQIGIDWTVVGRQGMVGGLVVPTSPIATLTDDHFMQPPVPNLDGTVQANRWVVIGSGSAEDGSNAVYGDAANSTAVVDDGLLESSITDSAILDTPSAQAAAVSRVQLTNAVIGVDNAILTQKAPVTISDLVPGAVCRLELAETCPPVSGSFRLKSVTVVAQTEANPETVTLAFQPLGTT